MRPERAPAEDIPSPRAGPEPERGREGTGKGSGSGQGRGPEGTRGGARKGPGEGLVRPRAAGPAPAGTAVPILGLRATLR